MKGLNKEIIKKLIDNINKEVNSKIKIMEICGTHTHAIAKLGIKSLIDPNIELISGPGCPVCVSDESYIDGCIELLNNHNVIIATFGDMIRVKGTQASLWDKKSEGKRVEIIYSPEDVLVLAKENKDYNIVFACVGFETTAPLIGCIVKTAKEKKIQNLFFFTALKRMEPVIHLMFNDVQLDVDGIICPGHVATITGIQPFQVITQKYGIPAVICGFEAMDIITGIHILVEQITGKKPVECINNYGRCVHKEGNDIAKQIIKEVFKTSDVMWRGIGLIKDSALVLRGEYEYLDVQKRWGMQLKSNLKKECPCRDILLGIKSPGQCMQFGRNCTPDHPLGPCMVSGEGSCATYYEFNQYQMKSIT